MTDLESRLRAALEDAAPVGVDTSSLADRARASARRTRRRTSGAVAASLVAVVLLGVGTSWALKERTATLPAHPSPTGSAQGLCAAPARPLPSPVTPRLSDEWTRVALCPADDEGVAWAQLPRPLVVTGERVDFVDLTSHGAPPESCAGAPIALPDFRLVLAGPGGPTSFVDGARLGCGGHLVAQTFSLALAEEDFARRQALGDPSSRCRPLDLWDLPSGPPRQFLDPLEVEVCVRFGVGSFLDPQPAPVRYRPVGTTVIAGADRAAVLEGLAEASPVQGSPADCPWRLAVPVIAVTTADGRTRELMMGCQLDDATPSRWKELGDPGQGIVHQIVQDWLEGAPNN
jgi:hypothetical protein